MRVTLLPMAPGATRKIGNASMSRSAAARTTRVGQQSATPMQHRHAGMRSVGWNGIWPVPGNSNAIDEPRIASSTARAAAIRRLDGSTTSTATSARPRNSPASGLAK